jgi:DNA-directed RNA polymerase subunit omega
LATRRSLERKSSPSARPRSRERHRRPITIATIDDLLSKVDSKYTLVHLAAQRAREINAYYHSLGEGLGQYTPPLVEHSSNKPLSIALEEIAAEKIVVQYPGEAQRTADELRASEDDTEDDTGAEILELTAEDLYDEPAAEPSASETAGLEALQSEAPGIEGPESEAPASEATAAELPEAEVVASEDE